MSSLVEPENTHHIGKYHCTTDLFDWFGFDRTSKTVVHSISAKQLNPHKVNKSDIQ